MNNDNYIERRKSLKNLSDNELKEKFWGLIDEIVEPMIDLAYKNTSPSIERSILLRMGFSSIESDAIVKKVIENNLISKGAGHAVYALSKQTGISIQKAGEMLSNNEGFDTLKKYFGGNA